MKRTPLKHKTPLKAKKGLKLMSIKTLQRNSIWRQICIERAQYLSDKYGFLICEYSGEKITNLTPVADDMNGGWGHHIDRNRNNCTEQNCYIVKYLYHSFITDHNILVTQEDFQGKGYKDEKLK